MLSLLLQVVFERNLDTIHFNTMAYYRGDGVNKKQESVLIPSLPGPKRLDMLYV